MMQSQRDSAFFLKWFDTKQVLFFGTHVDDKLGATSDGERLFTVAFDDGEIHEHVKESCVEGVLMEGLKVLAVADEWRSDGSFPGEIYKYNNNGTYVIHFDDGDVHEGIHREDIEVNKNQST